MHGAHRLTIRGIRSGDPRGRDPDISEPTIEGLIKLLPESRRTLGLFSSEGGSFIGGHAMSDDAKLRSAARLSALWDGEPIDRIRSTGEAMVMVGRRVALHLMAQPEASLGFLADRTLRDQGLLSRILVAAPSPTAGGRCSAKSGSL